MLFLTLFAFFMILRRCNFDFGSPSKSAWYIRKFPVYAVLKPIDFENYLASMQKYARQYGNSEYSAYRLTR